jgi:hypothetical protein
MVISYMILTQTMESTQSLAAQSNSTTTLSISVNGTIKTRGTAAVFRPGMMKVATRAIGSMTKHTEKDG